MNYKNFDNIRFGIVWCSTYERLDYKKFAQELNDGRWCEGSNGCTYPKDILFWSEDEVLTKVIFQEMQNDVDNNEDMKTYDIAINEIKMKKEQKRVKILNNTLKEFSVSHAEHFI